MSPFCPEPESVVREGPTAPQCRNKCICLDVVLFQESRWSSSSYDDGQDWMRECNVFYVSHSISSHFCCTHTHTNTALLLTETRLCCHASVCSGVATLRHLKYRDHRLLRCVCRQIHPSIDRSIDRHPNPEANNWVRAWSSFLDCFVLYRLEWVGSSPHSILEDISGGRSPAVRIDTPLLLCSVGFLFSFSPVLWGFY